MLANPLPPGTFASLFASRYASLFVAFSLFPFSPIFFLLLLISPFLLYFQHDATCCANYVTCALRFE